MRRNDDDTGGDDGSWILIKSEEQQQRKKKRDLVNNVTAFVCMCDVVSFFFLNLFCFYDLTQPTAAHEFKNLKQFFLTLTLLLSDCFALSVDVFRYFVLYVRVAAYLLLLKSIVCVAVCACVVSWTYEFGMTQDEDSLQYTLHNNNKTSYIRLWRTTTIYVEHTCVHDAASNVSFILLLLFNIQS